MTATEIVKIVQRVARVNIVGLSMRQDTHTGFARFVAIQLMIANSASSNEIEQALEMNRTTTYKAVTASKNLLNDFSGKKRVQEFKQMYLACAKLVEDLEGMEDAA